MFRFVAFALAGCGLGYVLNFLAKGTQRVGAGRGAGSAFALMTLRLIVFVVAVGWTSRAFGPGPGILVLVSAVLTRAWLVRAAVRSSASTSDSNATSPAEPKRLP